MDKGGVVKLKPEKSIRQTGYNRVLMPLHEFTH
jgi:hypothetical protein